MMVLYTQFNPNLHGQVNIFHDFNTLSIVLYLIVVRLKKWENICHMKLTMSALDQFYLIQ